MSCVRLFFFRGILCAILCCLCAVAPAPAAEEGGIFPFPVESFRLENGMEVVLMPMGHDGVMMDLLIVDVGVRFEKKPDEVEYTHLMEHLMFRGSEKYPLEEIGKINTRFGIYEQGMTASDFTYYFRLFPSDAFEKLTDVLTDRLANLRFTDEEYRAETGAVIGEYTGHYQMPMSMAFQKLYEIAYTTHPYRDFPEHLEYLRKMPENRAQVMKFYENFYRPNNCRLLILGDFKSDDVKRIITQYYGSIKPGRPIPEIPQEPPQQQERTAQVVYPGKTAPHLLIAYRLPGYQLNNSQVPAIDLLRNLYFTKSAPLYRRLVYDEKLLSSMSFPAKYFTVDPGLFTITLTLKDARDMEKVKKLFYEEVEKMKESPCRPVELQEVRERMRFGALMGMDSLYRTAFTYVNFYALSHRTDGISLYYKSLDRITPSDIQKVAGQCLSSSNRVVVTLVQGGEQGE